MSFNIYSNSDKILLAVDCIIFGFDKGTLKILLIKRDFEPELGRWSLMGGFLKEDENLDQAAIRILHHLTGLRTIYMEQLYTFSKVDRDPGERTLSVTYYALIDIATHDEELIQSNSAQWFSLDKAPDLIFDHNLMVEKAIARLKRRALSKPIGFELLPPKFTMRQLQRLYESILNKKLDKRNFINKINSFGILVRLDEKDTNESKKGAYLYTFDKVKYDEKVLEGFNFKI